MITLLIFGIPVVFLGGLWLAAKIMQHYEEKQYRTKKTEPKMTMSRSTATTVKLDLERNPTLEELEKFVEEARLAGVSPRAKVNVDTLSNFGYTAVRFSVRQSLDLE